MKKGFSLIEILIALSILSLIVYGIYEVLATGDKTYNMDMGLVDLQQQSRQAMDSMVRELRQGYVSSTTITSAGEGISFYLPNTSSAMTYSLSNGQIIRQYPAEPTKVLANDINTLNFCWEHGSTCDSSRLGSSIVRLQIRARKTVRGRVIWFPSSSLFLTEKVRLRNE